VRRSPEEVAAGILRACARRSLTVSQVMLSLNLSHRTLKLHLDYLVPAGLLKCAESGRKRLIRTTQLGTAVMQYYSNAVCLLRGKQIVYPLFTNFDLLRTYIANDRLSTKMLSTVQADSYHRIVPQNNEPEL